MKPNVMELRNAFMELTGLLKNENEEKLVAQFEKFNHLLAAIDSGEIGVDDGLQMIRSKYKSMHTPHSGLSDFFIWRDDPKERKKINQEFEKLASFIWSELGLD